MPKDVVTVIRESGAGAGDLIYVRSSKGITIVGARLSTSPDLLHLKSEALRSEEPLVAVGPATDETFADVVIDADQREPAIVKSKADNGSGQVTSNA
jgi:hypothetical protein